VCHGGAGEVYHVQLMWGWSNAHSYAPISPKDMAKARRCSTATQNSVTAPTRLSASPAATDCHCHLRTKAANACGFSNTSLICIWPDEAAAAAAQWPCALPSVSGLRDAHHFRPVPLDIAAQSGRPRCRGAAVRSPAARRRLHSSRSCISCANHSISPGRGDRILHCLVCHQLRQLLLHCKHF
jgi:hypothetical protein